MVELESTKYREKDGLLALYNMEGSGLELKLILYLQLNKIFESNWSKTVNETYRMRYKVKQKR